MSTGLSSTCSRLWSTWPFWVASHSWQATGCWLRKQWNGKPGTVRWWELVLKSVGRRSHWCYCVSVTGTEMNAAFDSWIFWFLVWGWSAWSHFHARFQNKGLNWWGQQDALAEVQLAAPSENGPRGHLLKWSGTRRKPRVEVCTLRHGETHIWQDVFTDKFVLLHDMSSSYNNINAGEARLFCSCAGELRFKRRKVRWGYLTAVLAKRAAGAYQRCTARGKGQHTQAKTGKTLLNVRDTTFISVLMVDWFFTVVSSATQCLMTVPWLRQPAGSLLAQASNTMHYLEFKPFLPSFPPHRVSMWDLNFSRFLLM